MALYATQGYIGFAKIMTPGTPNGVAGSSSSGTPKSAIVRVESCDIKTSQEIKAVEVVDGNPDTTAIQLGPKLTGGGMTFPMIHEPIFDAGNIYDEGTDAATIRTAMANSSMISFIWNLALYRDARGRMNNFDSYLRYTDSLAYLYPSCFINTLTLTHKEQGDIKVALDVMAGNPDSAYLDRIQALDASAGGETRVPLNGDMDKLMYDNTHSLYLSPARVATWNDIAMKVIFGSQMTGGSLGGALPGLEQKEIREFTVKVDNKLERVFTLNGKLSAFDIIAKKRTIDGTMKIIGHNQFLTRYANSNDQRYTSNTQIAFGYCVGATDPYFGTALNGVYFEIEEVSMSTGIFETSTKFFATADAATPAAGNFAATYLGKAGALSGTKAAYGEYARTVPTYIDND